MGFKDQIKKLQENWLILVIILGLFLFSGMKSLFGATASFSREAIGIASYDYAEESMSYKASGGYYASPQMYNNRDFAPDELDRKVVKTVYMSTETKRGEFRQEESKLKNIVSSSGSFIINENVNKYGEKSRAYYQGRYTLKVPSTKYDSVVSQLKDIGEVKSFSEDKEDITGSYTNLEIELEVEKERLVRYGSMFDEATDVEDKITLNDRIFDQERRIKYMEDQLENMDQTIDYSTISITLTEKQSEYAEIIFVKFSALVKLLVESFNSMLRFVFILLPWMTGLAIILLLKRFFKRKK
ncbi:DUF4349 domain-containing protein [Candidatus Woesearchaeota archaeon]|nr:DUF4349 domain-containing protein [Candidatus Woesearchaeota archaeon]